MTAASLSITPLGRLLWKEYRAIRGFWLALVALVVLIQLITIAFSQDARDSLGLIYNFALGAPAFFAVGCAGAAFAMEREEGTFDFLRAGPFTSRQVFISKLTLACVATAAMYLLLFPIALWFMQGTLPDAPTLGGMLGLWLVAALEAIAWGTLFSLLTARPLLAICLAIAAVSTVAHLLAWTQASGPLGEFSYSYYLQVAPWRCLVVAAVIAVDVSIGLRWLQPNEEARTKRRRVESGTKPKSTSSAGVDCAPSELVARPDRSAMLGHLLWQNWRQSWRTMAVMLALVLVALLASRMIDATGSYSNLKSIPMAVLAALIGSCVFLADQERRHYRFFVEHNVPARYVWLTRLSMWLIVATLATFLFAWFNISSDEWRAWKEAIRSMTNQWYRDEYAYSWRPFFDLDPLLATAGFAAVSFAAGQWASMFVRSGLMAVFFGLLLSGLLCGWVMLILTMRVGFWWTVAPVCAVLIFATWLRAPDWIRERSKWRLWVRDTAVLLIPAALLVAALADYRVDQISLVSPGFDPDAYLAEITPEALATGDLYRQAFDSYVLRPAEDDDSSPGFFHGGSRTLNDVDILWLKDNSKTLDLVLEATQRSSCALDNPRTINDWPILREYRIVELVLVSARKFILEKNLPEAMDRYFVALEVLSQLNSNGTPTYGIDVLTRKRVFEELRIWATAPGQTSKQITVAIQRLQNLDSKFMWFDDRSKALYVVARRFLSGDESAAFLFLISRGSGKVELRGSRLWSTLMPWENDRAMRMLNVLTSAALGRLERMHEIMQEQDKSRQLGKWDSAERSEKPLGVNDVLPLYHRSALDYFGGRYTGWHDRLSMQRADWMSTTNPDLTVIGSQGIEAAHDLARFETERRATMIILAIQAFQIDHGKLPTSLTDLVGPYLDHLPLDPYSGQEFVYLPEGLPKPANAMEAEAYQDRNTAFRKPGIWSTGPELAISYWKSADQKDEASGKVTPGVTVPYYHYRLPGREGQRLPLSDALASGQWYPIPESIRE